jgi:uroporphyrinogen-III decarboxylase
MESCSLRATRCQETSHIPIWIMRQAGRYMKDFRALRQNYSFLELIKTPELAREVTLQPIQSFGMDAAILFSDILVVADALGCPLDYQDKTGPIIHKRVVHEGLPRLQVDGIEERLSYVTDATQDKIPVTLFGLGNSVFYPLLVGSGTQVIAFDSKANMANIRQSITSSIVIQGNLDPHFLLGRVVN